MRKSGIRISTRAGSENKRDGLSVVKISRVWDLLTILPFNYRVIQKKYATGKPDQKDLSENLAAAQGLAHMITECDRLFEVSGSFQPPSSELFEPDKTLGGAVAACASQRCLLLILQ